MVLSIHPKQTDDATSVVINQLFQADAGSLQINKPNLNATFKIVNHAGSTGVTISFPRFHILSDAVTSQGEMISVDNGLSFDLTDAISGISGGC